VRREMIQTSINCIQKRLESNVVEEIVQKFLSASSAKELHEPLRSLAGHIPSLDLQQASREAYELDRFPVDLPHLSANKEVPMISIHRFRFTCCNSGQHTRGKIGQPIQ